MKTKEYKGEIKMIKDLFMIYLGYRIIDVLCIITFKTSIRRKHSGLLTRFLLRETRKNRKGFMKRIYSLRENILALNNEEFKNANKKRIQPQQDDVKVVGQNSNVVDLKDYLESKKSINIKKVKS